MSMEIPPKTLQHTSGWMNQRGSWVTGVVIIVSLRIGLATIPGISAEAAWTLTNLIYNTASYFLFHGIIGMPFAINEDEYNNLTLWEQMDSGIQFTPTKKYLTAVPIVLFLLSTHYTHYDFPTFMINLTSLMVVLIAKLPQMYKVRLFGINEGFPVQDK
ncbi:ORMDL family [Polychytrium aggregatum]|uniref:ORMDL family n=1 Tax=Polychytrium aggregatum TaxID=110093 RepID=UPI0022FE572A|nr:ORMDL family [Polychytrium aggregatum]KAI9203009.1 ORMDL family [Polychytrium aggregatum]